MNPFIQFLYQCLLLPVVLLQLSLRMLRYPQYRKRFAERFGCYSFSLPHCIWVHAVSGGEVITIRPIIEKLLASSSYPILITTMTPTGAQQIERLFGNKVHHVYLPYDFTICVKTFLRMFKPKIAIIVETEIWPILLAECSKQSIPTVLLNARLSEKSFQRYQKVDFLMRSTIQSFTHIAVQTQIEADRFHQLGMPHEKMTVTGSLKFDVERGEELFLAAKTLRAQLGEDRLIWCAASLHKGEEDIVLKAHALILQQVPNALLILVPKHPERFSLVAQLVRQQFNTALRSKGDLPNDNTRVYLGDTLGELVLFYAASDVAFVGGSLIPQGGHNLLEPASVKRPILSGPHLHNFLAISQWLQDANALMKVYDEKTLADAVLYLHAHPDEAIIQGERAERVCLSHRGAFSKQYALLQAYL